MLKKKMYSRLAEENKGYILYIEYSLCGIVFYRKEKHVTSSRFDYSGF